VALIAEVERRRLYAPAGHPSMFEFCVRELHLSEDAAYKRIRVARAARRYPQALAALADGRVHLSGLTMLAHYFKIAPIDELLTAATHKSKREIEQLLAERFPKPDLPALVRALPQPEPSAADVQPFASALVADGAEQPQVIASAAGQLAPGPVGEHVILSQSLVEAAALPAHEHARVAPLAPQRYGVQFTLNQAGHDLLRHVQNLLGNRVPPGDLAEVIVRALKVYAAQLEKQKFAATERPAQAHRSLSPDSRHVPSHVMRAVWKRDQGRCTYVSDTGTRCGSRWDLEFDHEQEYARGGDATVSNIRLRCRAHNQHAAERTFGVEFMNHKREIATAARERAAATRLSTTATPSPAS
jgi:5-methylcytosine-specific restriction endonuclease McrA